MNIPCLRDDAVRPEEIRLLGDTGHSPWTRHVRFEAFGHTIDGWIGADVMEMTRSEHGRQRNFGSIRVPDGTRRAVGDGLRERLAQAFDRACGAEASRRVRALGGAMRLVGSMLGLRGNAILTADGHLIAGGKIHDVKTKDFSPFGFIGDVRQRDFQALTYVGFDAMLLSAHERLALHAAVAKSFAAYGIDLEAWLEAMKAAPIPPESSVRVPAPGAPS